MAGYSIKNLQDVENSASEGLRDRLEARGFEGGPDGLEIIAIGADRPEGGDGELVRDWWTD